MCFNHIIEDLKRFEQDDGYNLEGMSFITLPFADDFNLITRDIRKHKRLMVHLNNLTRSMGLKLKPRKCRSLTIRAGKSEEVVFSLGDDEIGSILHDKYHKFLGGFYTFHFSAASVATVIKERVSDQLKHLDSTLIRNEYKVRIYADYLLGACRFVLSVHDLTKTQIVELDQLAHSYLKKWLGLPRGASWLLVHDGMVWISSRSIICTGNHALLICLLSGFLVMIVCGMHWTLKRFVRVDGSENSPPQPTLKGSSRRWFLP